MAEKKIIAVSDIHDDFESLESALDFAQTRDPDLVIVAGDIQLTPYSRQDVADHVQGDQIDNEGLAKRILANMKANDEEVLKLLESTQIPFLLVPGNYDGINFADTFQDRDIHKESLDIDGLTFAGYGGADAFPPHIQAILPLITPYDERELYLHFQATNPDVMVLHNPPHTLCDTLYNGQEVGGKAALESIKDYKPKLVVAGHIHEAGPLAGNPKGTAGVAKYDSTVVVNPGNIGRFALINPNDMSRAQEFDYGTLSEIVVDAASAEVSAVRHYSVKETSAKELAEHDLRE